MLIDASIVRDRLNLKDDIGINKSIESSILAAEAWVAAFLGTEILFGAKKDIFHLEPGVGGEAYGHFQLALSGQYVLSSEGSEPVVYTSDTFEEALPDTAEIITPATIEYTRGIVRLSVDYTSRYIRIDYNHGFQDGGAIPAWLTETLLGYTVKMLASQQIADGKPQLSNIFPVLDSHLKSILTGKFRVGTNYFFPIATL